MEGRSGVDGQASNCMLSSQQGGAKESETFLKATAGKKKVVPCLKP